jgi:hypothetical protein
VQAGFTNIVEVSCASSAGGSPVLGLRTNGTVVSSGIIYAAESNIVASLSGIVAVESDMGGRTFLKSNGTILRVISGGTTNTFVGLSNVVALSQWDDGFQALRADGTVFNFGSGGPVPVVTNVVSTASSRYAGTFLRRDQTIIDWGNRTVPTTNSYLAIASTGLGAELGVRMDGSSLTWGGSGPVTNIPPGLPKLRIIDGGYGGFVALCTVADFDPIFLHTALNTSNIVVSSRNSPQWFAQHDVTHDGVSAARSAPIGRNTASSMRMLMTNGPTQVSFWWKVSSETNHDFMTFSIGGVPQGSISGEVDWQRVTFNVPAGPQMLVWTYSKDADGTAGLDAGFVDQIGIGPQPPVIYAQPQSQTVLYGATVNFVVGADDQGQGPLKYRWYRNNVPGGLTTNILTVPGVHRSSSATFFVVVSNSVGSVTSSNAVLTVRTPQLIDPPLLQPDGTYTLTSIDADGFGIFGPVNVSNFQAQCSSNLIDWLPVNGQLSISNGAIHFTDTDATNAPQRFYRIIEAW